MTEEEKKSLAPKPIETAEEHHFPTPCVYIAGLGQTGRELVFRMMKSCMVVGIDQEQKALDIVRERAPEDKVMLYRRDATSRLTWKDIGLSNDDTLITATSKDDVNLEVLRIAKEHYKVQRLLSLVHDAARAKEYAELHVETVERAHVLASFLETRILRDRKTAVNIGLGHGEIMEVPILPGSTVVGRPLKTFRARPWLVGAIYRDEKLIVPHGNTKIQEGDRVIIIGEPHILAGVADFVKMGEPGFPLQYGTRIGVLPHDIKGEPYEKLVLETHYLASESKATSMAMLSLPHGPEPDMEAANIICGGTDLACEMAYDPDEEDSAWVHNLQTQDIGCLVIGLENFGLMKRLGLVDSLLLKILEEATYPILISRGTQPYESILVPVSMRSSPVRVAELAINLARLFGSRLDAVTVTEPEFTAGEEGVSEQRKVLDRVVELSSLYRMPIAIKHREGNPIKEIADLAAGYNLLVIGQRRGRKGFLPRFDLALEIIGRVSCSVMVLPYLEANN